MLDNIFTSLTSELYPLKKKQGYKAEESSFALILVDGSTLSLADIRKIRDNTRLTPLFFALSRGIHEDVARRYARDSGAPIVFPRSTQEFSLAMSRVAFSVSESAVGAMLSLISCTPAYVNASCRDCRSLVGELAARAIPDFVLMPYTRGRADKIKKVRARDSDFEFVLSKIRGELRYGLFNPLP